MKRVDLTPTSIQLRTSVYIEAPTFEQFQRYLATARKEFPDDADVRVVLDATGDELLLYVDLPHTPESAAAYAEYVNSGYESDAAYDFEQAHPWNEWQE